MYKILRILCCIVSALLLAACVFIFVYLGIVWGLIALLAAGAFAALTFFFKRRQEEREAKINPPPAVGDFITGAVRKDGEGEEKKRDDE